MSGFVGQPILAAAGFKPAFGFDYTCGKPPSKWTPLSISLIGPGRTGPGPAAEKAAASTIACPAMRQAANRAARVSERFVAQAFLPVFRISSAVAAPSRSKTQARMPCATKPAGPAAPSSGRIFRTCVAKIVAACKQIYGQ